VEAEKSLQDLTCEFNMLHPGDFEHAMFYLGNLDNINARLAKVDATGRYMMDDIQLINAVLSKIPNNKDGKMFHSRRSTESKEELLEQHGSTSRSI
jgi:hypothetical protein